MSSYSEIEMKKSDKNRRKKEEKEDGELEDGECEDESEDYDDYDFVEDTKNNTKSESKTNKNPNVNEPKSSIDTKVPSLTPQNSTKLKLTTQNIEKTKIAQPIQPQQSFTITNPYDIEYEDYDSDDDDYCNNKRLKIDESDDLPEEKTINSENKSEKESIGMNINKNKEMEKGTDLGVNDVDKTLVNDSVDPKMEITPNEVDKGQNSLFNDNEASSSSVASSKSASSVLTAISAISSDSLTISTVSASSFQNTNMEKIDENSLKKSAVTNLNPKISDNKIVSDTQNQIDPSKKSISPTPDENKDIEMNTKPNSVSSADKIDKTEEISSLKTDTEMSLEDSLKVPSLKIIFSNSKGGVPYVKPPLNDEISTLTPDAPTKTTRSKIVTEDVPTTPTKNQSEITDSKMADSPANNSRSKTSRSSRVSSPVAVSSYKSTPTRRSAAAAATAALASQTMGRSSPSTNINTGTNANLSKGQTNEITSYSNSSNSSSGSQGSLNSDLGSPSTRRKLRSGTRLGADNLPEVSRVKTSNSAKSPSPLTILSENANQYLSENEQGTTENTLATSTNNTNLTVNNNFEAKKLCTPRLIVVSEHSNSSLIDSDSTTTQTTQNIGQNNIQNNNTVLNLANFMPTRKKRNKVEQQQLQEQLDLINEIDTLNALTASSEENKHRTQNGISSSQQSNDESINSEKDTTNSEPILYNCIKKFVDLRNDLSKKRELLKQTKIDVKLPRNFADFILNRKSYLIKNNKEAQKSIPFFKPPNDLPDDLKPFFSKQEKERYSLRLRHRVEQDKLIILYEQEILRSFNKSAREIVNQKEPFSFCSMIKDDEIYSQFRISENASLAATTGPQIPNELTNQECQNSDNTRTIDNSSSVKEDNFLKSLNDLRNKFQKLKDDCIKRQLNESDSLHAVQKMDFQSKIRELTIKYKNAATNGTTSTNNSNQTSPISSGSTNLAAISLNSYNILANFRQNDMHIPIVHVNNKFDMLDVSQNQFLNKLPNNGQSNLSSNNNSNNSSGLGAVSIYA